MGSAAGTIWLDVGDVLAYFDGSSQGTGIQRVVLELAEALHRIAPKRVQPFRFNRLTRRPQCVSLAALRGACVPAAQPHTGLDAARRYCRRQVARGWRDFADFARPAHAPAPRAGDVLLILGAGWTGVDAASEISRWRDLGVTYAVLIHDLLPLSQPDDVLGRENRRFQSWVQHCLAHADLLFASSEHTLQEIRRFAQLWGARAPALAKVRFGTPRLPLLGLSPPGLAWPEGYVLCVSTLEPRKNHLLLVAVWRRLMSRRPAASVPHLVLVGKRGWGMEAFWRELAAADLQNRVHVLHDASDTRLAQLYGDCLFTAFPSRAEGWGFPVEESLAFGKLCLCSSATSLPEIGGALVDYFDPADVNSALASFERAIYDCAHLSRRTAEVRHSFAPTSWESAARSVLGALAGARPGDL